MYDYVSLQLGAAAGRDNTTWQGATGWAVHPQPRRAWRALERAEWPLEPAVLVQFVHAAARINEAKIAAGVAATPTQLGSVKQTRYCLQKNNKLIGTFSKGVPCLCWTVYPCRKALRPPPRRPARPRLPPHAPRRSRPQPGGQRPRRSPAEGYPARAPGRQPARYQKERLSSGNATLDRAGSAGLATLIAAQSSTTGESVGTNFSEKKKFHRINRLSQLLCIRAWTAQSPRERCSLLPGSRCDRKAWRVLVRRVCA